MKSIKIRKYRITYVASHLHYPYKLQIKFLGIWWTIYSSYNYESCETSIKDYYSHILKKMKGEVVLVEYEIQKINKNIELTCKDLNLTNK